MAFFDPANPDAFEHLSPEIKVILDPARNSEAIRTMRSTRGKLKYFEITMHVFEEVQNVNAGIWSGLFKVNGQRSKKGVVLEAKKYRIKQAGDGNRVEMGVAVRLAVGVSGFDLSAGLTIANIAAAAQLSMAEATVRLSVVGYTGSIGDLPAPAALDVEQYLKYMDYFDKIQDFVFSTEGAEHWSEVLLAT